MQINGFIQTVAQFVLNYTLRELKRTLMVILQITHMHFFIIPCRLPLLKSLISWGVYSCFKSLHIASQISVRGNLLKSTNDDHSPLRFHDYLAAIIMLPIAAVPHGVCT